MDPTPQPTPASPDTPPTAPAQRVDRTVIFGSAEVRAAGMHVSGGNLSCVFGSIRLDLREATLAAPEVKLEFFVLFGGVELRVPASWRVLSDAQPILGSVDEVGVPPALSDASPTLRLSGTVIFGELELERF
jgi:hypothetical protein